jgi:hypothetical protein
MNRKRAYANPRSSSEFSLPLNIRPRRMEQLQEDRRNG